MKKSQILATLALAFALGVVAPVASVSAYVLDGDQDSRTQFSTDVANLDKKVNALGDCTDGSKNLYANYEAVYNAIAAAEGAIETAEGVYATALSNARNALANTMALNTTGTDFAPLVRGAGNKADNAAWKNYNGTEVNAYASYDALLNYAKDLYNALMDAYNASVTANAADATIPVNTEAQSAAQILLNGTTGAIATAETAASGAKTTLDGVYNTQRGNINALLGVAPFNQVTSGNTTYALAKAAAQGLPKYGNFVVVIEQQAEIAKVTSTAVGAKGYTLAEGRAALAQQEKNVANFCSTTLGNNDVVTPEPSETPSDDKGSAGAPNSGVVAGADATAKATVSIMAAIASIATAAFVAIRKIAAGKKA